MFGDAWVENLEDEALRLLFSVCMHQRRGRRDSMQTVPKHQPFKTQHERKNTYVSTMHGTTGDEEAMITCVPRRVGAWSERSALDDATPRSRVVI